MAIPAKVPAVKIRIVKPPVDEENQVGKNQFIVINTTRPFEMLEALNLKLQSMRCAKMIDNFN